MTQTSHLKSPAITNLDTIPPLTSTTGEGATGYLREVSGFVTTVSADAALSTYQLVRVPTNAKIKRVALSWAAMTAGKVQVGVYYSDSTVDGTAVANQGLVVPTTGVAFFASDIDLTSASGMIDETFQNQANSGSNTIALINQPLWQALGLASDPGGFFDIVATVHTTAITAGALLGASVAYVD